MPFTMPNYPILTPEQANPFFTGLQAGANVGKTFEDILATQLANQKNRTLLPFVEPTAKAELEKALLANKWYEPNIKSEIGLRGAQSGLAGSQADINRFYLKNPAFLNTDAALLSQMLREQNNQPSGQFGSGQGMGAPSMGMQQPVPANMPMNQGNESLPNYNFGVQEPQLPGVSQNPLLNSLYYKRMGVPPDYTRKLEQSERIKEDQIKAYDKDLESAHDAVRAGDQAQTWLNQAIGVYEDIPWSQKGQVFGRNLAWSEAAQTFDADIANLIPQAVKSWQESRVTNADIILQQLGKPSRLMSEQGVIDLANTFNAFNGRAREYQDFKLQAKQLGVPHQVSNKLWDDYNSYRPAFNTQLRIPNKQYNGTWNDFLTPNAIESAMKNKKFVPENQRQLEEMGITKKDIQNPLFKVKKGKKEFIKVKDQWIEK